MTFDRLKLVVKHTSSNHCCIGHCKRRRYRNRNKNLTEDRPCTTSIAGQIEHRSIEASIQRDWAKRGISRHWNDGCKQTSLIRCNIGHPHIIEVNVDGKVLQWIVDNVQQSSLDSHGVFTVHLTCRRNQQNLCWHTDIEINGCRTWHVEFWIDRIPDADWVNPIASTGKSDFDHVHSRGCRFWDEIGNSVCTGECITLNTRHRHAIHKETHYGYRFNAINVQRHVEIIKQGSVHVQHFTSNKRFSMLCDG